MDNVVSEQGYRAWLAMRKRVLAKIDDTIMPTIEATILREIVLTAKLHELHHIYRVLNG